MESYRFAGFRAPHYTQIPDEAFDELMPRLRGVTWMVLCAIMRRIPADATLPRSFSLRELREATQLSRQTISSALDELAEKKLIKKSVNRSPTGGCEATGYQVNVAAIRDAKYWPSAPAKTRPGTKFTASKRLRIYMRDGYRCQICGTQERLSIDHVIPRSRGGSDDDANLQTLCLPCNMAKGPR